MAERLDKNESSYGREQSWEDLLAHHDRMLEAFRHLQRAVVGGENATLPYSATYAGIVAYRQGWAEMGYRVYGFARVKGGKRSSIAATDPSEAEFFEVYHYTNFGTEPTPEPIKFGLTGDELMDILDNKALARKRLSDMVDQAEQELPILTALAKHEVLNPEIAAQVAAYYADMEGTSQSTPSEG